MKRLFLGVFYCSFALFGGLLGGYFMIRTAWSLGKDPYKDFQLFTEVFQLIEHRHVAPPPQDKLIHSAIDGMVEQLDAHSHYIPPEKYKIIKKLVTHVCMIATYHNIWNSRAEPFVSAYAHLLLIIVYILFTFN